MVNDDILLGMQENLNGKNLKILIKIQLALNLLIKDIIWLSKFSKKQIKSLD